jgi:hypothetical protein
MCYTYSIENERKKKDMRNPNRIYPFMNKLTELWMNYPDLRFGQFCTMIANESPNSFFYLEEPEMEQILDRLIEKSTNSNPLDS